MKHQVLTLAVLVAVLSPALVLAQARLDEDSLKAAHGTLVSGAKSGSLTLLQAVIHPRAVGFFRDSQFPVQLRSDYTAAEALPTVLADLSRFITLPTDTVYRVVGQVGVVCMTATFQVSQEEKKKKEKPSDRFVRATYVYITEGGNWRLASWHSSDTPLVPATK